MNYEEQVKALRIHASVDSECYECAYYDDCCINGNGHTKMMTDAAAAIEELQSILTEADKKQAYQHDYICELVAEKEELQAETERLKAQLPKRGEWIVDGMYTYNLRELNGKAYEPVYRCSCCNRQMESYLRLDEPKMPEDADFPEYCPHCGAKMEVQE